jgi:release factor glutamine methyltransferase
VTDSSDVSAGSTVTWRQLLAEAVDRFVVADVQEPEISARRIVEECSGADGSELALVLGQPATQRGVAAFDRRVERRIAGEPIQYVLGRWGFRNLDLVIDRRVLIPRPETEIIAEAAIAELRRIGADTGRSLIAADLGCGSGAIGLSIADEVDDVDVWLTDISDDALAVARGNLAGLGRRAIRTRVAVGSWFDALPPELRGQLSVVVSNPPYIASSEPLASSVADWEPRGALVAGPSGTEALDQLVEQAGDWLVERGSLVLEMSPWQTASTAERAWAFFADVEVIDDLAGRPRGVVARGIR